MIKNGNYVGSTAIYEKLLPYIKKAFCQYYTDNKDDYNLISDVVDEKIDRTLFDTFIDKEYVETYYDKFICKYRDEILDRLYQNLGLPREKELDDIIWQKNALLSEANINTAMLGGIEYFNGNYSDQTIQNISDSRRKIVDYCGVGKYNNQAKQNTIDYYFIKNLHHKFLTSIREIEKEHPCDVFEDIERIERNNKKDLQLYLKSVNELVDNILDDDIKMMGKSSFNMAQVENLSSHGIFFNYDLNNGGLTDAFTSEASEILKDKHGDLSEQIEILCNRLTFMLYLDTDIKFKYLSKDEILNIKNLLAECNTRASCKELINKIKKEYDYQCSHCNASVLGEGAKDMSLQDKTEFQDRWFDGQFFDSKMADIIKEKREYYNSLTQNGLKYLPKIEGQDQMLNNMLEGRSLGINGATYEDNNIWKPINLVYVLDKFVTNKEGFLSTLVHELNHSMASGKPYYIDKHIMKDTSGISHTVSEIEGNTIIDTLSRSTTDQLEEYINERQSKEILGILMDILDKEKVKWPVDKVLGKDTFDFDTYYDLYDFIFDDFYELFKDELKKLNVDGSMKFAFDFIMPRSREEEIFRSNIKRFVNRNFNKDNFYDSGYVDMNNLARLNKLAETFSLQINPHLMGRSLKESDLTKRRNVETLPPEIQMKVYNLVKRKNNIMADISKDYVKKLQLEEKHLLKYQEEYQKALDKLEKEKEKRNNSKSERKNESTFEIMKRWTREAKEKALKEEQAKNKALEDKEDLEIIR